MQTHQSSFFFFFNDTATTEIYTLSLHDALPICAFGAGEPGLGGNAGLDSRFPRHGPEHQRSEEHTSELQSRLHLVCRLLLEKKKKKKHERSTQSTKHAIMRDILSDCVPGDLAH